MFGAVAPLEFLCSIRLGIPTSGIEFCAMSVYVLLEQGKLLLEILDSMEECC